MTPLRARPLARDLIAVVVLGAVAMGLGTAQARALRQSGAGVEPGSFNQRVYAAALMAACGRGLATPTAALTGAWDAAEVHAFVLGRHERIDCAAVPANLAVEPLDGLQRASRYLLLAVSAAWAVGGTQWPAIDMLLGVMFAVTIALAYVVGRAGMGRWMSGAVAGLLMLSPLHLRNLADVRDYSKAPFFMLCLAAVGFVATQALSRKQVIGLAGVVGMLLGIGFGMRTDVLVNVVIVITVLLVFLPGPWSATWPTRAMAAGACGLAFGVMAAPLSGSFETRSSPWHVSILGYADPWTSALEVAEAPYETGHFYSDSYVSTAVDAYWGARGHGEKVSVGLPGYGEASRSYYFALLSTFPGDVLTRGWASLIKVIELPFSGAAAVGDAGPRVPALVAAAAQRVLLRVEGASVWLFAVALMGLSLRSVRLAALVFFLAVVLGTYPSIQFQPRHLFHLEIVSLWMLAMALSWLAATAVRIAPGGAVMPNAEPLTRSAGFMVAVLAVIFVPWMSARAYQQRSVTELLTAYVTAATVPLPSVQASDGMTRLAGDEAGWPRPRGPRSMYGELLAVDLTGDCGAAIVGLSAIYRAANSAADFSRSFDVGAPAAGEVTRVFLPIFETGATAAPDDRLAFAGIDVPSAEASCVAGVSRIAEPERLSLLLPAVLVPQWQRGPLHQRLARWEDSATADSLRFTGYWAPPALKAEAAILARRAEPGYRWPVDYNVGGITVQDAGVAVRTLAEAPGSYLVAWQSRALQAGSTVLLEGRLERGGFTVGFTSGGAWIASVDIDRPGAFRAGIRVPETAPYQLVIANHLRDGARANRFTISSLALERGGS